MGHFKGLFKKYKEDGWAEEDIREARRVFLSHKYIVIDEDSRNFKLLKCSRCGFTITVPRNIKNSVIFIHSWKDLVAQYDMVMSCQEYTIKEIIK